MHIANRSQVVRKFNDKHQHYDLAKIHLCLTSQIEPAAMQLGLKQGFSVGDIKARVEERYQSYLNDENDALETLIFEFLDYMFSPVRG